MYSCQDSPLEVSHCFFFYFDDFYLESTQLCFVTHRVIPLHIHSCYFALSCSRPKQQLLAEDPCINLPYVASTRRPIFFSCVLMPIQQGPFRRSFCDLIISSPNLYSKRFDWAIDPIYGEPGVMVAVQYSSPNRACSNEPSLIVAILVHFIFLHALASTTL